MGFCFQTSVTNQTKELNIFFMFEHKAYPNGPLPPQHTLHHHCVLFHTSCHTLVDLLFHIAFMKTILVQYQILEHMQPDSVECKEKLEKIFKQIEWRGFPGLQALLMKGCTNPLTAEPTWNLLSTLTTCIKAPVVSPEDTTDGKIISSCYQYCKCRIKRFPPTHLCKAQLESSIYIHNLYQSTCYIS